MTDSDFERDIDNALARYAPACVVINSRGEILQSRGGADRFLELHVEVVPLATRSNADQCFVVIFVESSTCSALADSFLNAVSHELRTPLNAILLWTQVLRRCEVTADRVRYALQMIEQSALEEARLVDDLLEVAMSRACAHGSGA